MSLASFVERYRSAIVVITLLLAAAGLYSAFQLPSDIYPPLIFPRVVVIGHSGTLPAKTMMLTVTRPIARLLRAVAAGNRQPLTVRGDCQATDRHRQLIQRHRGLVDISDVLEHELALVSAKQHGLAIGCDGESTHGVGARLGRLGF